MLYKPCDRPVIFSIFCDSVEYAEKGPAAKSNSTRNATRSDVRGKSDQVRLAKICQRSGCQPYVGPIEAQQTEVAGVVGFRDWQMRIVVRHERRD